MLATVWHSLIEPWQQAIDRRAFLEVLLLGLTGGTLGCWIIFYNLSYSTESLAHALLPGLVLAALAGIPLILGGAIGLVVAALAIAAAARTPAVGRDTAVAVVVTGLLGLGALLALSPDTPAGLGELLFGDVLGVSDSDLALAGGLALIVLVALALLHGRLLLVGFDRLNAAALGVRPAVIDVALLLLVAGALLVAVQGLGNLLVVAVLVGPAACARAVTQRMSTMMVVAAGVAVLAGCGGLYLSYYAETAAGASIAAVIVGAYALSLAASTVRSPSTRRAAPRRARPQ
ncbi:MAG TPA: metal ABC transporter permease [Baekduia sp.]|nr:metal ABC transporter permease [Baekduia sp.]